MFSYYNPNPFGKSVGDCVIRALSKALNETWNDIYIDLFMQGYKMKDMPSSNMVWGTYLKHKGFNKVTIPLDSEGLYDVSEFILDHNKGLYIVGTGSHVVTINDSVIYDTWDCSKEIPAYYFVKEK